MPTDTFLKLSEEKRQKIIQAAKNEFARVTFSETSIKNIVEEAGIARGSFYQYFESKEDLLNYILSKQMGDINKNMEKTIEDTKGDIFEVFISMYDYMVNTCINKGEVKFFQKIFENIKTSEDTLFSVEIKHCKPRDIYEYYDLIDKSNLNIKDKNDFKLVLRILYAITRKAIVSNFKYESEEQARKDFLREIELLKYGIMKTNQKEREETEC